MEKMVTVVGMLVDTFESKEGHDVSYARLYVLCDPDPDKKGLIGQSCESIKADPAALQNLEIGMRIVPLYNKWGKCVGFNAE